MTGFYNSLISECFYFQLDNQIPGAVFPTVIAPIPPPKSVAAESGKNFAHNENMVWHIYGDYTISPKCLLSDLILHHLP